EEVPAEFVPPVEPPAIRAQKPFHSRHKVPLGSLCHQMKVIAHKAERMHLPACFLANLRQRPHEPLPILVIPENRLSSVTSAHHVVNRPGIFHSDLAGHAQTLSTSSLICKYQELTRFMHLPACFLANLRQ